MAHYRAGPWQHTGHRLSKHNTDTEETTSPHLQPIPHSEQEGLQDDKPDTMEPKHTIPDYILPAHNKPTHHRPDLIRAARYASGPNGKLIRDPTYLGRRQLQLIECKYSTDGNVPEIINHIHTIYEPLKQSLQYQGTLKRKKERKKERQKDRGYNTR